MENKLPESSRLKLDLMFDGIRYSEALVQAAKDAYPNFYPYRFQEGEFNPTGKPTVPIPYLLSTEDDTHVRIKGNGASPWSISRTHSNYFLSHSSDSSKSIPVHFEPLPSWMAQMTSDGFPMAQAGVSLHGDMAVINIAPGCEYFSAEKENGKSMRCSFCSYGAPDKRTAYLGQVAGVISLPDITYQRMQETLVAACKETEIRHIYLVGGSLQDWESEGKRFVEIARAVREVNKDKTPVTCGSGALPNNILKQLYDDRLVDNVCFNLEVWSEELFAKVCPGKNKFVGYQRWIESLEFAVSLWGRGHVYSAMVAGIELEPEYGFDLQAATDLAVTGAEELCSRGILPIYSLYWPVGGRDHPKYLYRLRNFFENLNLRYREIRKQNNLRIWDGFMCNKCAYMQLECDLDR
jgi:hypothetical protein